MSERTLRRRAIHDGVGDFPSGPILNHQPSSKVDSSPADLPCGQLINQTHGGAQSVHSDITGDDITGDDITGDDITGDCQSSPPLKTSPGWTFVVERCPYGTYCQVKAFRSVSPRSYSFCFFIAMIVIAVCAGLSLSSFTSVWGRASLAIFNEFFGEKPLVYDRELREYVVVCILAIACPIGVVMWYVWRKHVVVEESVMVVPSLGVQVSVGHLGRSGLQETQFYDSCHVRGRGFIINEAVTLHRVIFYLALVVSSSGPSATGPRAESGPSADSAELRLIPLFMHAQPCFNTMQEVYRELTRDLPLSKSC